MEITNIAVLAPLIVVSLLLTVVAIVDLIRRPETNGPKVVWALVILFLSTIGPILYFIFGRRDV
ncbi:PLD nuclease N-terminal domain-containing protein [Jeotgalibacillus proteolyticus]|uniref:Transcriptional regulator n=1 Tax=Jeotgalibacillus proteolyticus TaxID=2082395 RepID=A0A2S5G640_9BACL|nr:PLD nuclease N-terminal domain-containing protein [Jeotgalibacillus proteolyticus]PPA68458.1 transcriptional regulator [Jeotgalibacillus proteolyticus]